MSEIFPIFAPETKNNKNMIEFNQYENKVDHTWYDSSNVVYSACYDTENSTKKSLKVVFKGGRTYLYKDVDANDYIKFSKNLDSSGKALNEYIVKKYKGIRLGDTDLEKLNTLKESFQKSNELVENATKEFEYELQINNESGEFRLLFNGKPIYEAIEGQVSIVNLFRSMHLDCKFTLLEESLSTVEKFEEKALVD